MDAGDGGYLATDLIGIPRGPLMNDWQSTYSDSLLGRVLERSPEPGPVRAGRLGMHTQVYPNSLAWCRRAFECAADGFLGIPLGMAEHGSRRKISFTGCLVRGALACSIVTVPGRTGADP